MSAARRCACGGTGSGRYSPETLPPAGERDARLSSLALASGRDGLPLTGSRSRGRDPGELRHKDEDKEAALTFIKKAPERHGSPEAITTDGLRSYSAAMKMPGNTDKQEVGRWANNRAKNSHLPFRRRERGRWCGSGA
ncbi:DDE-type integrase/transposase/recombinase [Sphingomonas sp. CROZ-RG-20F-R02-07]|uniref:DDE-type integrase/transposase/recombinase n=1 Tax=Sphingomonas sp. CROZ-RG-20F-R02-07 TaxID=2914832 RepID=UPI001F55ED9B|nr:DDE-type integrase/transposase/recombinase [Sphingomonas sp. CROZ-RG-20F-R02-07]